MYIYTKSECCCLKYLFFKVHFSAESFLSVLNKGCSVQGNKVFEWETFKVVKNALKNKHMYAAIFLSV